MCEKGVISIDNPSEFFMTKREEGEISFWKCIDCN